MSTVPEWAYWLLCGLCFVVGWSHGALHELRRHIETHREHQLWLEEYTATVNRIIDGLFDLNAIERDPTVDPTPKSEEAAVAS